VHSSEIYEIGPLLKGGELLLTTGLGLAGKTDDQLSRYVADLAGRGVAGVFLELGRTFTSAPGALLQAARVHDLPLVLLHGVVPFIEVTEQVHHLLIDREITHLRRHEEVSTELISSLLTGAGLSSLMHRIGSLAGCPAALFSRDDRLVASSGEIPDPLTDQHQLDETVEVFGSDWGRLVLFAPASPYRQIVLARGVVVISLELARSGTFTPARQTARRALLHDIASGRFRSAADIDARAAAVGVAPRPEEQVLVACITVSRGITTQVALNAIAEAGRQVCGAFLASEVDGDLLLAGRLTTTTESGLRRSVKTMADAIDRELALTNAGHVTTVVAGPLADRFSGLVRSVAPAREASQIGRSLGASARVLLSSDVGVYRLLSRLFDDPELERFVSEQLGALLDYDARHNRALVATLDEYLANGLSKTNTARALGIRRQTLYSRLERISTLLGDLDLDQRERRTALDLALSAWRLRSSAGVR
jgi:purine catabolism regulator